MREDTPDRRRLVVGIDPGVSTGFAIWDAEARALEDVRSMLAIDALLMIQSMVGFGSLRCVVYEDARLRTWFGLKGREALQGAGSIKRDCQIWGDWLARLEVPYKAVSPKQKGGKLDAAQFKRVTGWQGRTNDHGRDAAMLVFGWR